MGTSYQGSAIAVLNQGAWGKAAHVVPGAVQTAAYVDVDHQLNVFWVEAANGVSHAHFTRTKDGSAFDPHEVLGWQPSASAPLFRAGDYTLIGTDANGTSRAYYDSDAMDWHVEDSKPLPFTVSSAATLSVFSTVLLGYNDQRDLCDLTIDTGTSPTWGDAKCHPELHVATAQEIPSPPPQLVAFPNGGAVAVYFTSYTELTAVVLHAGEWSAPVTTKLPDQSLSFAVTSTPSGDVFAGLVLTSEEVVALRFSPTAGWTAPITLDTGATTVQRPAAATGVCGDDALFAYSAGGIDGEIRVARVRGSSSETTTVAHFTESVPSQLSLATRHVPVAF